MLWPRPKDKTARGKAARGRGPVATTLDTRQFTPWPPGAVLVGGAVRDALLGRPPTDLDWLVPDPRGAALALADATGGSPVEMDASRRHWRVALPGGPTHDLAPLRDGAADVLQDLALRDLTVNALGLTAAGEVLDPTGGRADLEAGTVRVTSPEALAADPVRMLRVVRFAAALDFRVADQTLRAVRDLAAGKLRERTTGRRPDPKLAGAAERVGAELTAILLTPKAAQAVALLDDLGLLDLYLPEVAAMRGVSQGRGFHHLPVLGHSLEALNQLLHGFPDASVELRWATLLHDVGKPATRQPGPLGRVTFYGHDKAGAEMTSRLLTRLRVPSRVAKRAASLVRYHMVQLPKSEREARRFVLRRRELLPDLLQLMIADREAARGPLSSDASRTAYKVALSTVLELLAEAPPPGPLLGGNEVMELLGLEPGPRVGEALALVAEARAVGDVHDAAGARAMLLRYAEAQGW